MNADEIKKAELSVPKGTDLELAERQAKSLKANELAAKATSELGENLGKKAERWVKKGKSRFWIVKQIAKIVLPFANLRRRQDIVIIYQGIKDACDRQDEEATQKGIDLLKRMTNNEVRMPVDFAKLTVNEWLRSWRRKAGRPLADDKEGQRLQKEKEAKAD
jgi:hypothetical protein